MIAHLVTTEKTASIPSTPVLVVHVAMEAGALTKLVDSLANAGLVIQVNNYVASLYFVFLEL